MMVLKVLPCREACHLGIVPLGVRRRVRRGVRRSRDHRGEAGLEELHILAAGDRRGPDWEARHKEVVERERGNRLGVAGREHRSMRSAAGEGGRNLVEADIGPVEERLGEHHIAVEGREAVDSPEEDRSVRRGEVVRMRRKAALWSSQSSPRSS